MDCYIVDIDGTCADLTHRRRFVDGTLGPKKDWDGFFANCHLDEPIHTMRELLLDLREGGAAFVYVSGRPERTRSATLSWLHQHGFPAGLALYMRADGDRRPDTIVKSELLDQLLSHGLVPILAFDDRTSVVKMWRARGIPCFQVAEGDF